MDVRDAIISEDNVTILCPHCQEELSNLTDNTLYCYQCTDASYTYDGMAIGKLVIHQ